MRNIVKFQIEKYAVTLLDESAHKRRAFGSEQGAADFDGPNAPAKTGCQFNCMYCIIHVEGDYELIHSFSRAVVSIVPVRSRIRSIS